MKQIDTRYNEAVQQIKSAILQSQLEATKAVNRQMLALYYGIGKYVSDNTRTGAWGTGAIETISEQLRRELPGLRGFSPASIKKMRIFYEQWSKLINRSPLANDLDWHEFMSLSFSHHYEILAKTETLEERAFYIHQAATLRWDKYTLRNNLKADLFHHQSQMPNNFATTMPSTRYAAKAISMFKDDYILFVEFDDGYKVLYDVKDDIKTLPSFRALVDVYGLFKQAQLDTSRTCVYWNDKIDLASDSIYEYGKAA